MTSAEPVEESAAIEQTTQDEMARYGITRVSADYYHYKQYRYTRLNEALAQAERELATPSVNGRGNSSPR
jgi:hypothetical protein